MNPPPENSPMHHTQKLMGQAEVLTGLVKAFGDFKKKNEAAWRC